LDKLVKERINLFEELNKKKVENSSFFIYSMNSSLYNEKKKSESNSLSRSMDDFSSSTLKQPTYKIEIIEDDNNSLESERGLSLFLIINYFYFFFK
jgi:hypothetical protein